MAAALGRSLTLCHPRMIASVASWPQCLRKRGIELKVGIEIEMELEVAIEIDVIRYRGKTSSPAIITAAAAIISIVCDKRPSSLAS